MYMHIYIAIASSRPARTCIYMHIYAMQARVIIINIILIIMNSNPNYLINRILQALAHKRA